MPTNDLPEAITKHIQAVNAHDTDAATAPFADDAYVNDVQREIKGKESIRKWIAKELIGDSITMEVVDVVPHHGTYIVRAKYDGTYDKTNLPNPLILTNYFAVEAGKIVSLTTLHNKPSPY